MLVGELLGELLGEGLGLVDPLGLGLGLVLDLVLSVGLGEGDSEAVGEELGLVEVLDVGEAESDALELADGLAVADKLAVADRLAVADSPAETAELARASLLAEPSRLLNRMVEAVSSALFGSEEQAVVTACGRVAALAIACPARLTLIKANPARAPSAAGLMIRALTCATSLR